MRARDQMLISVIDRAESIEGKEENAGLLKEQKTLCEKEKMLVSSIFSFSHNAFKWPLFEGREIPEIFGKRQSTNLSLYQFELAFVPMFVCFCYQRVTF